MKRRINMFNKKKIKELEDKLFNQNVKLKKLNDCCDLLLGRIISLERCHRDSGDILSLYHDNSTYKRYVHYKETNCVNTELINNVTLEELAKFVIDHKPIERKQQITVKYHKGE